MSEPMFPVPVEQIAQTLIALMKNQAMDRFVWILEGSTPIIDYLEPSDYGGQYDVWQLRFEVPVERFANIENELSKIEETLQLKVQHITRGINGHHISRVVLTPQFVVPIAEVALPPPDVEVERIWGKGSFRLFISHLSKDKIFLTELKQALLYRGVSGFLAHENIEPTKKWQDEIELALRSMQAMMVFLVDGFIQSKWTDQEVGWAMGRGVLVLPVKVDIDPYGFMGKYQALRGQRDQASALANMIVELLVRNPQTHDAMRAAIVNSMVHSQSYVMSQLLRGLLTQMRDYTEAEKQSLLNAITSNRQVSDAFGVPEWIKGMFGKPEIVDSDDDLPF